MSSEEEDAQKSIEDQEESNDDDNVLEDDDDENEDNVLDDDEDEDNDEENGGVIENKPKDKNNDIKDDKSEGDDEEGSQDNDKKNNEDKKEENKKVEELKEEEKEEEKKIPEEESENEDEEKVLLEVTNEVVRKLIQTKINNATKADVIKTLLDNQIVKPKPVPLTKEEEEEIKEEEKMKITINPKYNNTISEVKKYKEGKTKENKFKKDDNFHIFNANEKENPEFIKSFDVAQRKIMCSSSSEDDKFKQIYNILYGGKERKKAKELNKKTEAEIEEEIKEKVKKSLNKKQEVIDRARSAYYQDQNNKCTFAPETNVDKNEKKRSLKKFIKDQMDFKKTVEDKNKEAKDKEEEDKKKAKKAIPTIDKNSAKIYQEKIAEKTGKDKPIHERLFDKKYATAKTSILAEKEKQKKEKEEKEKQSKEKEGKKEKKKKILPWKKKTDEQKEPKKIKRSKDERKNYLLKEFDIPTKKILETHFDTEFEDGIKDFYENYQVVNPQEENKKEPEESKKLEGEQMRIEEGEEENPKKEIEPKEELINGYLSKKQLHHFLSQLAMCSEPLEATIPEAQSMNQKAEHKLINKLFKALKNPDNDTYIPVANLKKFLKCVFGLYYYELYQQFMAKDIPEKEIEEKLGEKATTDDIIDWGIRNVNEDIINQCDPEKSDKNKYISYPKEGTDILIPIEKAKKIKIDFNLLSINYSESKNAKAKEENLNKITEKFNKMKNKNLQPKMNEKSKKLSEKYREKINS